MRKFTRPLWPLIRDFFDPAPDPILEAWRQEIFELSQETNFSQRVNGFTDRNKRLRV